MRRVATCALLSLGLMLSGCCGSNLIGALWAFVPGGVGVDSSKIGTGDPAFVPKNDVNYFDGVPADQRSKH